MQIQGHLEIVIGGLSLIDAKNGVVYLLDCDNHRPQLMVPLDLIQNGDIVHKANQKYMKEHHLLPEDNPLKVSVYPDGKAYVTVPLKDRQILCPDAGPNERFRYLAQNHELDLDFVTNHAIPDSQALRGAAARVDLMAGTLEPLRPTGLGANNLWTVTSVNGDSRKQPLASAFRLRRSLEGDNCVVTVREGDNEVLRFLLRFLPNYTLRLSVGSLCPFSYDSSDPTSLASDVEEYGRFYPELTLTAPVDVSEATYRNNPVCPPGKTNLVKPN